MAYLNKVFLIGNLTRDPELRYLQSGTAVCDFGVAVNRTYKSGTGEQKEEVVFVDVTAWARQAEVVSEFLQKGKPIFLEGRLKLDQWTGDDGQKRSKLCVVMENFQFLDSRGGGEQGGGGGGSPRRAQGPQGGARKPQQQQQQPQQQSKPPQQDDFDAGDDSIPF
jgi:single-strand DNA-binding protein